MSKELPYRGSGDVLPWKISKIRVLGNGISGILRRSQHGIMFQFF